MTSYEYTQCVYHSHDWQLLTCAGWITERVEGNIAIMIRRVR